MSYVAVHPLAHQALSLPLIAMSGCLRTPIFESWEAWFCLGRSMGGKGLSWRTAAVRWVNSTSAQICYLSSCQGWEIL